jgi:hypothetical protein
VTLSWPLRRVLWKTTGSESSVLSSATGAGEAALVADLSTSGGLAAEPRLATWRFHAPIREEARGDQPPSDRVVSA